MSGEFPTAASVRTALAIRCGDDAPFPGAWRAATAAVLAGVTGADAFLCHLSRSIAAALERVMSSAEDARARLHSIREADPPADTSHCDELEACINIAETRKRVALEREVCTADVALERLRAERGAVAEAAASLSDADLMAQLPELTARLDAAEAQLLALPTAVVEPPYVGLVVDEQALLAGRASFGRIVAPSAITAADLELKGVPSFAYPGGVLSVRLVHPADLHAPQSSEELEVSLGAAAYATVIEASLKSDSAAPQTLQVAASADVPGRCVVRRSARE